MVFSVPTWLHHVESFREEMVFIYTSPTESLHPLWNLTASRVGGGKGGEWVFRAEEQGNSFLYSILGPGSWWSADGCTQAGYILPVNTLSAPTSLGQSTVHAVLGFFKIDQVLLGYEESSFSSPGCLTLWRKRIKTSLIIYEFHANGWMQILLSPTIDRGLHCYNGEKC